jgi:2-methylcitrate dehydratase PrpD
VSGYDGKWGLAYCMALMLVDGRVDVASFDASPRAGVIAVARRMNWQPMQDHGFPERFAARIELQTEQGRRVAAIRQVLGAPDRPVSVDDIRAKFADNATRKFSLSHAASLEAAILALSDAPDTDVLANLLSA